MSIPQPVDTGASFELDAIVDELRGEPAFEREGHTARTLVRTDDLRVVVVAMREGQRLAKHAAHTTASVQTIAGRIVVGLSGRRELLPVGHLLVFAPNLEHDVYADTDAAFVLTLGWPAGPATG